VLNEDGRIQAQIRRMRDCGALAAADTIIVDGGSTDGSVGAETLRDSGLRALLVKTGPGRQGAQLRAGLSWLLDQGYEGVILIDGNNKDDPSAIPGFVQALEEGWDHIQGSRFVPGGHHRNTPWARLLGVRLLHAPAISLASGFRYTDTTNGFRAYSRRFLLDGRVQPFRDVFAGYELHYYLAIRAARLGFKVKELPVGREYPSAGAAPTKIHGLQGNAQILKLLFRACTGAYNPGRP
jgi:glycosyltransferase involved in cell wall biosynthesis